VPVSTTRLGSRAVVDRRCRRRRGRRRPWPSALRRPNGSIRVQQTGPDAPTASSYSASWSAATNLDVRMRRSSATAVGTAGRRGHLVDGGPKPRLPSLKITKASWISESHPNISASDPLCTMFSSNSASVLATRARSARSVTAGAPGVPMAEISDRRHRGRTASPPWAPAGDIRPPARTSSSARPSRCAGRPVHPQRQRCAAAPLPAAPSAESGHGPRRARPAVVRPQASPPTPPRISRSERRRGAT
jgi:hypothetical protein